MTDTVITDFIDIVGIREDVITKYLTIRFENLITHRQYFFRIAKDLFDVAYENRSVIDAEVVLKPEGEEDNVGYVS